MMNLYETVSWIATIMIQHGVGWSTTPESWFKVWRVETPSPFLKEAIFIEDCEYCGKNPAVVPVPCLCGMQALMLCEECAKSSGPHTCEQCEEG